jgi:hypothetical protein
MTDTAPAAYPDDPVDSGQSTDDLLMVLAHQVYGEFADRTTFANVHSAIRRCARDLESANVPVRLTLVDRLARQRLTRELNQSRLSRDHR